MDRAISVSDSGITSNDYAKIEKEFNRVFTAMREAGVNQYVANYVKDRCVEAMRKLANEIK